MNPRELQAFLEKFHSDKIASFLTNSSGFIIEANQAAANFFSSEIPKLKNKSLRSFIADRKNSQVRFDSMRERAEVIGRGNKIVLMLWKFISSESKSTDKDQSASV